MTLILIALGLTLAWYPAKLGWAYYLHRRAMKQYLHDVKTIKAQVESGKAAKLKAYWGPWPTQDPVTGQWRMETAEEAAARRKT